LFSPHEAAPLSGSMLQADVNINPNKIAFEYSFDFTTGLQK
jgi:hypothetical protein